MSQGRPPSDDVNRIIRLLQHVAEIIKLANHTYRVAYDSEIPHSRVSTEIAISTPFFDSEGEREAIRSRREADDQYRIDTRYDQDNDEILVVADLPGVGESELSVEIDDDRKELVVGVRGEVIERITLPQQLGTVESRFNHGVIEFRVRPEVFEE